MLDDEPTRPTEDDATSVVKPAWDDALFCASCGHLLTRQRWATSVRDGHQHVVFNPAGHLYRVRCFGQSPGAFAIGPPSHEFTWFPDHLWQIALCVGCDRHIGWRFVAPTGVHGFWGLNAGALTAG